MTQNFSWEGSFGSQLLAEISLLEAQAKVNKTTNVPIEQVHAVENVHSEMYDSTSGSFGSQLLAEISLLEAQAKEKNKSTNVHKVLTDAPERNVMYDKTARTFASQLLAEISLLEVEAKANDENTKVLKKDTQAGTAQEMVCDATDIEVSNLNFPANAELHQTREAPGSPSLFSQNSFDVDSKLEVSERVELKPVTNPVINSPLSCSTPVFNNIRKESLRGSTAAKLQLQNWGLPAAVVKSYSDNKISNLFPWQVECLTTGQVLQGSNLIYSAPTSSGKTLVAELLMLKTSTDQKKKGLYILPFVAVAREKARVLKNLTQDVGLRVESFAGSTNPPGGLKNCDIAICTIEKANSMINRLIEEASLNQIGIVVVDELHLIGDRHRGYLLELLLTKLLYVSHREGASPIQIVGMSATLPNLNTLAKWLRAELFCTDFRPIALQEHIKIGQEVWTPDWRMIRQIQPDVQIGNDTDHVAFLSLETVVQGYSAIIFCPTKNWCEKMAQTISSEFYNLGAAATSEYGMKLRQELKGDLLNETLQRLKNSPAGLDPILGQTIRFGVAFHHAGLTSEERDIIESSFRHNILRVLVATSTLSSGVNLPARRVIIRTPIFHGQVIDPLVYRQMIGRAGRYGVDTMGESYLICQPSDKVQVQRMFGAQPQPLQSCLLLSGPAADPSQSVTSSLKRAMLEIIATGSAINVADLKLYASCTLLAAMNDVPEEALLACVTWLVDNEFIRRTQVGAEERLAPTQLGLACLASSLSPDDSLMLLSELEAARKGLILETDLHLVYLVTPTYVSDQLSQIDWLHYLTLWEELTESRKRVGHAVGVEERFLIRAMKGTVSLSAPKQSRQMAIHRRFYTSLALNDLINEVPLSQVAHVYKCNKGMLQGLQQQTATFAGMMTVFCQRLGWSTLHVLLEHFQSRLQFGVQLELIDLMKLSNMDAKTARLFYNAGLVNVLSVATASPESVELLLRNASPFESGKQAEDKSEGSPIQIQARELVAEARQMLQQQMGVNIQWNQETAGVNLPQQLMQVISANSAALVTPKSTPVSTSVHQTKERGKRNWKSSRPGGKVTKTKEKSSKIKKNLMINVTPDMFQDSAESPIPGGSSPQTPQFAACSEEIVPVTEPVHKRKLKRRVSNQEDSVLEATQAPNQSIGWRVAKKTRTSPPLRPHSLLLSSSDDLIDSSCLIPSTDDREQLNITEVSTVSVLDNFIKNSLKQKYQTFSIHKEKDVVVGIAASWAEDQVYYIGLRERFDAEVNRSRLDRLKKWLQRLMRPSATSEIIVYGIRSVIKDLRNLFHLNTDDILRLSDVELSHWVLEPANQAVTMTKLLRLYAGSSQSSQLQEYRGRDRCCFECKTLMSIYASLRHRLSESNLWKTFVDIETPVVRIMLKMEDIGMHFDRKACESLLHILRQHLKTVEDKAHQLVGHKFSLTSTKETSKVIMKDVYLPVDEDTSKVNYRNPLKKKVPSVPTSVSKAVLVKLGRVHPLPRLIVEYRKVSAIVQNIVCPLLQASTFQVNGEERIAGECEFRTETGRINITQPTLQHIPRPFQLSDGRDINLRTSFRAPDGKVLLSADYSQLELRILAHLCGDSKLCSVLSATDGDVFRIIASGWRKKPQSEVTDEERQQAKQICYGIIYGMGCKTLADQLEVTEEEARLFVGSFHSQYPGIQPFLTLTIDDCRAQGYIETVNGRRRYLPAITSSNPASRAAAERAAVNSRIQGSAADLVKTAMILIDRSLATKCPEARLVHQIHDELLFEVPVKNLEQVAKIVEHCMETAIVMKIRLPVAIKKGPTWGNLEPYKIQRL